MKGWQRAILAVAAVCVVAAVVCIDAGLPGQGNALPGSETNGTKETDSVMDRIFDFVFPQRKAPERNAIEDATGEYTGNVYHNDRFGISAEFDDGWYFFDSKERDRIKSNTYERYGQPDAGATIYDLFCQEKEKGMFVTITIDDCERLFGKELTEEEYLENTAKSVTSDDFSAMGYSTSTVEKGNVMVSGKTHASMDTEGTINGNRLNQRYIALKDGDLMMLITITSPDKNGLDTIQTLFGQQ